MTTTHEPAQAELQFHPLANVFPLIEGDEFKALVEDIREHGVLEPIWLYEGKILDGRNRYRAYQAAFPDADEDPPFREYLDDKPVEFVISLNLKRRHLNESQRGMVADNIAKLKKGDNQHAQICAPSQEEAADLLNVSRRTVQHARRVHEEGAPELVQAVERGTVSVSAAADVASLPQDEQQEIVARGEREILKAATEIRARKNEARLAARAKELSDISRNSAPLPQDRQYPVLLVDPPWQYETAPLGDAARAVDDKYPTCRWPTFARSLLEIPQPRMQCFLCGLYRRCCRKGLRFYGLGALNTWRNLFGTKKRLGWGAGLGDSTSIC